jgi:hypothetical protein
MRYWQRSVRHHTQLSPTALISRSPWSDGCAWDPSSPRATVPGVEQWSSVYPNCAGDTQSPVALPSVPAGVATRASDLLTRLRSVGGLCTNFFGRTADYTWMIDRLNM